MRILFSTLALCLLLPTLVIAQIPSEKKEETNTEIGLLKNSQPLLLRIDDKKQGRLTTSELPAISLNLPKINSTFINKLHLPYWNQFMTTSPFSSLWYQGIYSPAGKLNLAPIGYRYSNRFEGADMIGYRGLYGISPAVTMGMSSGFSSGYFGPNFPNRINNVSLGFEFHIKISDDFSIHGAGAVTRGR